MQHSGDQGREDHPREGTRSKTNELTDQLKEKAATEMLEELEKAVDLPAIFNPESAHAGKQMLEELKKTVELPAIINPECPHAATEMLEELEKAVELPTIFNVNNAHATKQMLVELEKAADLPAIINPESTAALDLEALNPKSTATTLKEEEEQQQEHFKLSDCKLSTLPASLASDTGGVHHSPLSLSSSSVSTLQEGRLPTCMKCPITSVLPTQGEEIVSLEPYLKKLKIETKTKPIMMKKVSQPKESEFSDGISVIEIELRQLELAVGLDVVEEERKLKQKQELEKQDQVAFLKGLGLCSDTESTSSVEDMEEARRRRNERHTRSQLKRMYANF